MKPGRNKRLTLVLALMVPAAGFLGYRAGRRPVEPPPVTEMRIIIRNEPPTSRPRVEPEPSLREERGLSATSDLRDMAPGPDTPPGSPAPLYARGMRVLEKGEPVGVPRLLDDGTAVHGRLARRVKEPEPEIERPRCQVGYEVDVLWKNDRAYARVTNHRTVEARGLKVRLGVNEENYLWNVPPLAPGRTALVGSAPSPVGTDTKRATHVVSIGLNRDNTHLSRLDQSLTCGKDMRDLELWW